MVSLRYLFSCFTKKTKKYIVILFFASLCLAISEAITFIFISKIFSLSNNAEVPNFLCIVSEACLETNDYLAVTAMSIIILFCFGILTVWVSGEVGARVATDLAVHYFYYLEKIPINTLALAGSEKIQNILLNESYRVGNSIVLPSLIFVVKFFQIIALCFIAVISKGHTLLIAGLVPIIIYLLITLLVSRRLKFIGKIFTSTFESRLKLSSSTYNGIKEIKVNSSFSSPKESFLFEQKLLERNQVSYALISNLPRYFLELILMVALVLVIYTHVIKLNEHSFSDILVIGFFALRLVPLLQLLYSSFSAVRGNIVSLENYVSSSKHFDQSSSSSSVRLKSVCDSNILGGLTKSDGSDFLISIKDSYVVTGPSGSGKTSTIDFLVGLRTDNVPHTFLNSKFDKKNLFSYCGQNTFIDDQFIQNILVGLDQLENQRGKNILELCSKFKIDELIIAKKNIKNVHFQLSGGERQRLAIIAAILKNADFFVFDEPTNNLDSVAKSALKSFLLCFRKGFIVITHDEDLFDIASIEINFKFDAINVINREKEVQ